MELQIEYQYGNLLRINFVGRRGNLPTPVLSEGITNTLILDIKSFFLNYRKEIRQIKVLT